MRTNLFNILLVALFLCICNSSVKAQEGKAKAVNIAAQNTVDSVKNQIQINQDVLVEAVTKKDSISQDTLKPRKSKLEDIIRSTAKDYVRSDNKKKISTLYNEAKVQYQDLELQAGIIIIDHNKEEVYAGRIKDSLGNLSQRPIFKQGNNVVEPDSIRFNFKTKKALVWNSRTQQMDLNIKAAITKKENDSVYFMKDAIFTTAKDIDNPEYYFHTRKLKMVPGKKVVVGLTNMVIMDVPTPIGLPFAFFPITSKNTSGFIIPSFGESNRRGYFLQNGGYYFALSDHYDLTLLGDYYTNGSYALRGESSYGWRYKFKGNVNVRFENLIDSERGLPDYTRTKIYNIQWSHSQDGKSNPSSRFSASVNMGSSTYFQRSINHLNIGSTLNNTMNSSISYSKTFNSVPQVNMSVTATHSQNTQTQNINMTLPTLQLSVDRIYPFAGKDESKKGILKNINFQYNLNGKSSFNTTDSLFFSRQMFADARTGMQHSIPITTNFKMFKYFSVPISFNYNEVWTLNTIRRNFDQETNQVVTSDNKGFDAFRTYNFSTGIGTTIYGTFDFGSDKNIQAIRHVMKPSVTYNYTPSFDQYYDDYPIDALGTTYREYTRFENSLYGTPSNTYASNVGFSVANNFEAKVKDKDPNAKEPKKVMLLNNLNFATSYNMAADSLRWNNLSVNAGTTILNNKLNINLIAQLDPYALDAANKRINKFNIDNGGSLFRLTSANLTLNYSFSSAEFSGNAKAEDQTKRNGGREDDLFGTSIDIMNNRESQFKDDDKSEEFTGFYNAKLPWDLRLAYSLTYNNMSRQNEIVGNSIMVSGNVDITPKWKVGVSTGYDFVQDGFTFTQFRFERDLASWRMDFTWVPSGYNAYWGFFIGIKSSMLQDIKWEKRKTPDQRRY